MNDESPGCMLILTILGFILILSFAFFAAWNEAKSYRKFCDRDVTTWDALFLDLRIDECKKQKE